MPRRLARQRQAQQRHRGHRLARAWSVGRVRRRGCPASRSGGITVQLGDRMGKLLLSFAPQFDRFTVLPIGVSAQGAANALVSVMGLPSKPVTRSPFISPPCAAGPSDVTSAINAPCVMAGPAFSYFRRHRLDAHADPAAPRHAKLAQLLNHIARQIGGNGEANADAAAGRRIDRESIPTTSPSTSNRGPPELPGLIGASVWMKSS